LNTSLFPCSTRKSDITGKGRTLQKIKQAEIRLEIQGKIQIMTKKIVKLGVLCCVLLSGLVLVAANTRKAGPAAFSLTTETQNKLYVSNCARCHGSDGKGNTQLGQEMGVPDLTTSRLGSARVRQIISKGDGDMPAFGKKLKAAQINSLVNTVRSFRK
jgi:cytochrome c6